MILTPKHHTSLPLATLLASLLATSPEWVKVAATTAPQDPGLLF